MSKASERRDWEAAINPVGVVADWRSITSTLMAICANPDAQKARIAAFKRLPKAEQRMRKARGEAAKAMLLAGVAK